MFGERRKILNTRTNGERKDRERFQEGKERRNEKKEGEFGCDWSPDRATSRAGDLRPAVSAGHETRTEQ